LGKKLEGVEGCTPRVRGLVRGISLPSGSRVWGGGFAPSQKIFEIFA